MAFLIQPLMVGSGMIIDVGAKSNQNKRNEMNTMELLLLMAI